MKVCLISFDYWGYDEKIVGKMNHLGYESIHIKLSDFSYKYKNTFEKITNFVCKILFNKNIKKIKSEEYIINVLRNKGPFDKIIVINPERISKNTHLQIRKFTKDYLAYLYDSLERHNAKYLLNGIFNKIFSFDQKDANQFQLTFLPNYIHFEPSKNNIDIKYTVFSLSSIDERYKQFEKIIAYFNERDISHKTLFFDKRKPKKMFPKTKFINQKLSQEYIYNELNSCKIILDIIRPNQTGVSFRIYDAIALEKKVITTNKHVKNYDFYNPNNICVIDIDEIYIPTSFIETNYEKLNHEVYNKYTLENWIKTILN